MKATTTQQEVLLMTGTGFSARQCCEKDESDHKGLVSEQEQLEEACWNGLLPEILPEIFSSSSEDRPLYLWQIKEGNSFIELELGETPAEIKKESSINPYSFLPSQLLS